MSGTSNTAIGDDAHPASSSKIITKVQELAAVVPQQRKGMEVLTAQLQEQPAQIQKVSAQLEMSKPAAKVVVNKP